MEEIHKRVKNSSELIPFGEGENLNFNKISQEQIIFSHLDLKPSIIYDRDSKSKIVVVDLSGSQKIYQVKDKRLELASEHIIDLPVEAKDLSRLVSGQNWRYLIRAHQCIMSEKTKAFFEKHDLQVTPQQDLTLIFEWKCGVREPAIIKPNFLGIMYFYLDEYIARGISNFIEPYQGVLGPKFCLFEEQIQDPEAEFEEFIKYKYLAEYGKSGKKFVKKIFQFNFNFEEQLPYKKKIREESYTTTIPDHFWQETVYSGFIPKSLILGNPQRCKKNRLQPFFRLDLKMIILGLFDLRSRKVATQCLVSISELFEGLPFTKVGFARDFQLVQIDYFQSLDFLVVDLDVLLWVDNIDHPEAADVLVADMKMKTRRRDPKVLKFFSKFTPEQEAYPSMKIRFKVFNVLRRSQRRIEVSSERYDINSFFTKNEEENLIICSENSPDQIKIEILNHPSSPHTLHNGLFQPSSHRDKESKFKKKTVKISLDELLEKNRVQVYHINSVELIDQDALLLISERQILLFDLNSRELLSFCDNESYPSLRKKEVISCSNLLAVLKGKYPYTTIEIDRLINNSSSSKEPFERLGIINLTIYEDFLNLEKIFQFNHLEDGTYELIGLANWMVYQGNTFSKSQILGLNFAILDNSQGNQGRIELLSLSLLPEINERHNERNLFVWRKTTSWNIYTNQRTQVLGFQVKDPYFYFQKTFFNFDLRQFEGKYFPVKVQLWGDLIYAICSSSLSGVPDYALKLIGYNASATQEDDSVILGGFNELKSMGIGKKEIVRFDEISEIFRIFCMERMEDEEALRITVFGEGLEVIKDFAIEGIQYVQAFRVIDNNLFYLSGWRNLVEKRRRASPDLSKIVDCRGGQVRDITEADGNSLVLTSESRFENKLVGFTGVSFAHLKIDQIFMCDLTYN